MIRHYPLAGHYMNFRKPVGLFFHFNYEDTVLVLVHPAALLRVFCLMILYVSLSLFLFSPLRIQKIYLSSYCGLLFPRNGSVGRHINVAVFFMLVHEPCYFYQGHAHRYVMCRYFCLEENRPQRRDVRVIGYLVAIVFWRSAPIKFCASFKMSCDIMLPDSHSERWVHIHMSPLFGE